MLPARKVSKEGAHRMRNNDPDFFSGKLLSPAA
jgi:hypothetical protein